MRFNSTFLAILLASNACLAVASTVGIVGIDVHQDENAKTHNTAMYRLDDDNANDIFLVRRGGVVLVSVTVAETGSSGSSNDELPILFEMNVNPDPSSETWLQGHITAFDGSFSEGGPYFASKQVSADNNVRTFQLNLPATAPIGAFYMRASVSSESQFDFPSRMVVLVDAANPKDQAYIDDDDQRNEYVFSEAGMMWLGSAESNMQRPWAFDQFTSSAILVVLRLFEMAPQLSPADRGDLVNVGRYMSALTNVNDDNGVLWGRWDGNYGDGTNPSAWGGSKAILDQFYSTGQPVRYAQCWVFACTLTTLMRTLGVGARPLTNFASAHESPPPYDSVGNMYYEYSNGQYQLVQEDVSVWNFHAWTEMFLNHRDNAASGWQEIDATPQEMSDGLMQMGPASVKDVHDKVLTDKFDVAFVRSEVACVINTYVKGPNDDDFKLYSSDPNQVGVDITTKAVGSFEKNIITSCFKSVAPAGTRRTVLLAENKPYTVKLTVPAFEAVGADVDVDVEVALNAADHDTADPLLVGMELTATLGDYSRNKNMTVTVDKWKTNFTLSSSAPTFKTTHTLTAEHYTPLINNGRVYLNLLGSTVELPDAPSSSLVLSQASSMFVVPQVSVELEHDSYRVGDVIRGTFSFTNPLSVPLSNIVIETHISSGLTLPPFSLSTLAAKAKLEYPGQATARHVGTHTIIVTLTCDELDGVVGHAQVVVKAADDNHGGGDDDGISTGKAIGFVALGFGVAMLLVTAIWAYRRRGGRGGSSAQQGLLNSEDDYA